VILPTSVPARPSRDKNTRQAAASDFISPDVKDPELVRAFVETAIRSDPIHVDWRDEHQFLCDSSGIRTPTLVIYGERDPNVEPRGGNLFFRRISTADKQMVMLPGADHCAHLESTHDAWITAIETFLNRPGILKR